MVSGMTRMQLLAIGTPEPIREYLTSKSSELWTVLLLALVFTVVFWLLETKSEAQLPSAFLVAPPVALAGSTLLLIASL